MTYKKLFTALCAIAFSISSIASTDWSDEAILPGTQKCKDFHGHQVCYRDQNRANIWQLPTNLWQDSIINGAKHALYYPVTITPLLLPKRSLETFFYSQPDSPIRRYIFKLGREFSQWNSVEEIFEWLGLTPYPQTLSEHGPNPIPAMGEIEQDPMGVTMREGNITFSCAACHTANLFGTRVLGMTKRFPRANHIFVMAKKAMKVTPKLLFKKLMQPTPEEYVSFLQTKNHIRHVGLKMPQTLGLDTSLAQVGLSLARRNKDEYATFNNFLTISPRSNELNHKPADSKPAVWWNLKYKTRWLSDGSIISGNPIHTNFLWNEIGRGVDLKKLESWLINNKKTIQDLTAYVFAAKSPRYEDYFPGEININLAKQGQQLFMQNCSGCHGEYEKGWDNGAIDYQSQLITTKVWYHEKTPVIDVGTDPYRAEGMQYFASDLNRLKISKTIGTVVVAQKGYVPPPLEGIWSRWPYFHNNSAPTLYAVLTPDFNRPKSYIAVPADDKDIDFDREKNGYPEPDMIRSPYQNDKQFFYDTRKKGMSNQGHTKMLLDENGNPKFNHQQKRAIIEFLKTL